MKKRDDHHFESFLKAIKRDNPDLVTFILNLEKEIHHDCFDGTGNPNINDLIQFDKRLKPLEREKFKLLGRNANEDVVLLEKKVLELEKEISCLKIENTKYRSDLESQVKVNNNLTEKLKQLEDKNSELSGVKEDLMVYKRANAKLSDDLKSKCDEVATLTERCRQLVFANEGLTKQKKSFELELDEVQNKHPSFPEEIKQTGTNLKIRESSAVMGIALLNQRIYIVCLKSPKIFVFEDNPPYLQLTREEFEITSMQDPRDLISSPRDRCLFIADVSSSKEFKIWQLETITGKFITMMSMPANASSVTLPMTSPLTNSALLTMSKMGSLDSGEILECDSDGLENRAKGPTFKITNWVVNKKPKKLSVSDNKALRCNRYNVDSTARNVSSNLSSSPNFIVVLTCECNGDEENFSVIIYRISDKKMLRNFTLTPDIGEVQHVVVHTPQDVQWQCRSFDAGSSFDSDISFSLPILDGNHMTTRSHNSNDSFFNDILDKSTLIVTRRDVRRLQDCDESLWLVSRLRIDGSKISCFIPAIVDGIELNKPEYIALVENGRIIVADCENNRLVILGAKLTGGETLVKTDAKHKLNKPSRVVYSRDKRMLVVSEWGKIGVFDVFVF
ncbi:hypothetical protein HELRODRAFT_194496 [Helobdella robusta]|uniref:Uncharacterized protein n=1 Tax=Helobdella robusta TaxID=6412 RepID=T1FW44_HELRO|nr:hypothetical protein HELRODRAFT_194496 [Helobdella robusta]ESN91854.1 hypothetical protein HELRODRAFT_194496 [Helobdella robusta]